LCIYFIARYRIKKRYDPRLACGFLLSRGRFDAMTGKSLAQCWVVILVKKIHALCLCVGRPSAVEKRPVHCRNPFVDPETWFQHRGAEFEKIDPKRISARGRQRPGVAAAKMNDGAAPC